MSATAWNCSARCWAEGGPHGPDCTSREVHAWVERGPDGCPTIVVEEMGSASLPEPSPE